MTSNLEDPINEDFTNFVITYQSAVSFPIYTLGHNSLTICAASNHESLMTRESSSHGS